MNGKSKCKILKDIRRQIAAENDIEFVTSECQYQGDCTGTCPKCESEVRYLEAELAKRKKAGKAIAVAGIAATLLVGSTGCGLNDLFIDPHGGSVENQTDPTTDPTNNSEDMPGEIPPDATRNTQELMGEPLATEPPEETVPTLAGDVPDPDDLLMGVMAPPETDNSFWNWFD